MRKGQEEIIRIIIIVVVIIVLLVIGVVIAKYGAGALGKLLNALSCFNVIANPSFKSVGACLCTKIQAFC